MDREIYWKNLIEEWQANKETITSFCKHKKINPSTFYGYRKKLGLIKNYTSHQSKSQSFKEIVIDDPFLGGATSRSIVDSNNFIKITLPSGLKLEIPI